jgi:putative thioredoxin
METAELSFDVTTAAFEEAVVQRSLTTPVMIDFWAEWCGPCKQIKPLLEKIVAEYHGAFVLAKVDIDAEQQLAGYVGIRSVPTLMLVKNGQIVDGFSGALPEAQLRQFLAQHGITPAEPQATEPEAVEIQLDPAERLQQARAALAAAPDDDALKLDLALALADSGAVDEAEPLLDALPAALATDDRAVRARATLNFARALDGAPGLATLEERIAGNPDDSEARHLLAVRCIVGGDSERGMAELLELLRRDRNHGDGLPRRALIEAFSVVADEDLVGRTRRRMASLLF